MFLTTYLYVQFAALPEQSSSYQFSGCIIKCNINALSILFLSNVSSVLCYRVVIVCKINTQMLQYKVT